jgi:hypothetical protein
LGNGTVLIGISIAPALPLGLFYSPMRRSWLPWQNADLLLQLQATFRNCAGSGAPHGMASFDGSMAVPADLVDAVPSIESPTAHVRLR